jgi:hypothetical protein
MTTAVVPIVWVADAGVAVQWHAGPGFGVEFEHRFAPHLPLCRAPSRGRPAPPVGARGGARPGTLVYIWVDAIEPIAAEFCVTVDEAPRGREVSLADPDQNRLRVAEPVPRVDVDGLLGAGTVDQ